MSKVAEIELGTERLVVFEKDMIFSKVEEMASAYADVKKKHSLFAKYPMKDNETMETWSERILPLMADENKKGEKESNKDYLSRVYTLNLDKHLMVFDTVRMIAKCFGQEAKATEEGFKKTSYLSAKRFVVAVFESVDLPTRDFE